jgi:hypothetical protein
LGELAACCSIGCVEPNIPALDATTSPGNKSEFSPSVILL